MSSNEKHAIRGDRPLEAADRDRLGFREVAKRIGISLVDRASEDGLVIGLEGEWGSGKSSLLNLIGAELKKLPDPDRPSVINFRPWLIGNRDGLIAALFGDLTKELERIAKQQGKHTGAEPGKAKIAADAMKRFVTGLSKISPAFELAGEWTGLGFLGLIGKLFSAARDVLAGEEKSPSLDASKKVLVHALKGLGHRIIVTVDDVDRLEPAEVIEILRLVRSVADLPNVIYLLCYDSDILAHSIEEATKVKSGKAYLEKIVQLTVMVPTPEPFQLRQWFTEELNAIASPKDEEELSRLKEVVDYEGGRQLKTPRAVVRALDAVRFFWPPLRDAKADLADLVWVQFIKNSNPKLYRWIEEYCGTASVYSLGAARIEDVEKQKQLQELLDACPKDHFYDPIYRHTFAAQLPGVVELYAKDGPPFKLFERVSAEQRDRNIRQRRLASPDHYRMYFALTDPSHAVTSDEFASVWQAADQSSDTVGRELLSLYNLPAAGNLTKADMLLERVRNDPRLLSDKQKQNMFIALGNVMDEVFRLHPFDRFWVNTPWDRAERCIPSLLQGLKTAGRLKLIRKVFHQGAALDWLNSVFRRETFAHGRVTPDRKRPESEWILREAEYEAVQKIMLARYRKLAPSEIPSHVDLVNLLFAWLQAGDDTGPGRLITRAIKADDGFLEVLKKMTSSVTSSSRGNYPVLKRSTLSPFMDYDDARYRVEQLAKNTKSRQEAEPLVKAFEDADEDSR